MNELLASAIKAHGGLQRWHELRHGMAFEFETRAKSFGLDVSLHSLPEGQHNFIFGAGRVPEVDQAILEMARWLRFKLGLSAIHP